MAITGAKASKDPPCEGWLEKLALRRGFSLIASKGWNKRYCFLTRRGLGYCRVNPRDKDDSKKPLRQADAKCFIPFERHKGRETLLLPVYYARDVSVSKNPEVPTECVNGICTAMATSPDDSKPRRYYYFGVTFEEKKKRYTLFLRTDSAQEYIKWTSFLPLYVHQSCTSTLVPFAHPLEVNRQPPVDMNRRRLVARDSEAVSEGFYLRDPDPCTAAEYSTIRRRCLEWNEGERIRIFPAAKATVKERTAGSEVLATKSLEEEQQLTFEQRMEMLDLVADALCANVDNDDPNDQDDGDDAGDISAGSDMERLLAATANVEVSNTSQNVVVGSAHDGTSAALAPELTGEAHVRDGTAPEKKKSSHKSGHHHKKKGKQGGKEALYSNASEKVGAKDGNNTAANGPSRTHSALATAVNFTEKDDAMKGSNDTNGRTPRGPRTRDRKRSHHKHDPNSRPVQQRLENPAALNTTGNYVDPENGAMAAH